jgi:hypothetical protein
VVATANYYRDQLGFHYERLWNEPPSFCMVKRNGIVIMLAQLEAPGAMRPNRKVDSEGSAWDAYIWIDNADALYAEFKSKGVKIAREICDQIYGCRDFDVETATAIACVSARTSKGDAKSEMNAISFVAFVGFRGSYVFHTKANDPRLDETTLTSSSLSEPTRKAFA